MSRNTQNEALGIVLGILEVIGVNILLSIFLLILASVLDTIAIVALIAIGLTQLVYVIPRAMFLNRRQRWARMKGVIVGAVIIALLNGGCWLLLYSATYQQ